MPIEPFDGTRHNRCRSRRDRLAGQPPRQVLGESIGTGVAPARVLLEALQADDFQIPRHSRVELPRWLRRPLPHLVHRLQERWSHRTAPAGQQGVEDRSQPVDVGRGRQCAAFARSLLGRHVGGRADDRPRVRQLAVPLDSLGQAEVGDMRLTIGIDQDIRRLQVAMEDASLVSVVDRLGRRRQQSSRARGSAT